ncbi:unnamed protein product, partial [Closterium sp. NIES-54]
MGFLEISFRSAFVRTIRCEISAVEADGPYGRTAANHALLVCATALLRPWERSTCALNVHSQAPLARTVLKLPTQGFANRPRSTVILPVRPISPSANPPIRAQLRFLPTPIRPIRPSSLPRFPHPTHPFIYPYFPRRPSAQFDLPPVRPFPTSPLSPARSTSMAVAGSDFAIVAGDTRLSTGYSIYTRSASKIFRMSAPRPRSPHLSLPRPPASTPPAPRTCRSPAPRPYRSFPPPPLLFPPLSPHSPPFFTPRSPALHAHLRVCSHGYSSFQGHHLYLENLLLLVGFWLLAVVAKEAIGDDGVIDIHLRGQLAPPVRHGEAVLTAVKRVADAT